MSVPSVLQPGRMSCGMHRAAQHGFPLIGRASIIIVLAMAEASLPAEEAGRPAAAAPPGMVWIRGGEFAMGNTCSDSSLCSPGAAQEAQPVHRVQVEGFWMDTTVVTNARFAAFVSATGYVTVAERIPAAADFPGVPPEKLVAGALVFTPPDHTIDLHDVSQWWRYVEGANWRHPLGPASDVVGKDSYPVVQIAYHDALAYAGWAGKRLPTESEWEYAARGGLVGKLYVWGDELKPGGKWMANLFQGRFPVTDTGEDGFAGIAPVAQYPANGYGLYDMAGNVWQWCSDWYRPDAYAQLARTGTVAINPTGPADSFDPGEPGAKKRVQRGGSFLCTDQYCTRYLVGSRGKGEIDTGSNHVGFRCVRDGAAAAANAK
jgi:formylglycine-generating enzyme required for sulfatase activity